MFDLDAAATYFNHLNLRAAGLDHEPPTHAELKLFDAALGIAQGSTHPRVRVGCLLVQKNRIIAAGTNQVRTHPIAAKWKKRSLTLCAEMDALLFAQKDPTFDPKKTTAYIGRLGRDYSTRISFPCDGCFAAMLHEGIRRFVCSDWNQRVISFSVEE